MAVDHPARQQAPMQYLTRQTLHNPNGSLGMGQRPLLMLTTFSAWLCIVIATLWFHEYWRDEVRAYSMAIASPSFWELPDFLKNEGHPVLWYALLRLVSQLLGSSSTLPVVSVLVAASAILIFLLRAPFTLSTKLLFTFSVLPLYEYSVSARNYGISMLLMFGFAAVYRYRREQPLVVAVLLALLANTNVHSLLVAGILTALWLWEAVAVDRNQQVLSLRQLSVVALGATIVLLGALLAVKTILPDQRSTVVGLHHVTDIQAYIQPLAAVLRRPWEILETLLPFSDLQASDSAINIGQRRLLHISQALILATLLLGLIVRLRYTVALLMGFMAMGYLFNFVYFGSLRHQGILFVFMLVLYWLNAEAGTPAANSLRSRLHALALNFMLPVVLLWGDWLAASNIHDDYVLSYSSCKSLGEWLKARPEYRQAIVMGEPDSSLEALPHYANQKMYIPRESHFSNFSRFTTAAKPTLSLTELLDVGQQLKSTEHQPVLLALGLKPDQMEQTSSITHSYGKVLTWTPSEWHNFTHATTRVASFWSADGDENFDLYEIH